jgi:hypothetical protein
MQKDRLTSRFERPGDRMTVIRIGVPVYAITRETIDDADRFGVVTATIRDVDWRSGRESRALCETKNREKSRFGDDAAGR